MRQIPEGAHGRQNDETIAFLRRPDSSPSAAGTAAAADRAPAPPPLYFLSLVASRRDASVRRGAVVKALAVATPHQYLEVFKTPLVLALDHYLSLSLKGSRDRGADGGGASGGGEGATADRDAAAAEAAARAEVAVLAGLFAALNGVDLSELPRHLGPARALMWRGVPGTAAFSAGASPRGRGGSGGGGTATLALTAHCPSAWTWQASCTLKASHGTGDVTTVLPLSFPAHASPDDVVGADTPILSTLAATLGGDQLLQVVREPRAWCGFPNLGRVAV